MIKILFVCHGNICRSPMAEFLMKKLVKDMGISDKFLIESAATSTEEIGNGVHYGTRQVLRKYNIDCSKKRAVQITPEDYDKYDYIIGMDSYNIRNMKRIFGEDKDNKISLLLDYTNDPRNVADPWYTGNFTTTENDVLCGCRAFLKSLKF
ncbi:MAG: low molecular weight phosphotyrosine protein phosphatase [Ruminococcaceae bacterium]|nr:low molecular weight phosphotyrosine protein phosphatase [Oscillospiraceae bacterium]